MVYYILLKRYIFIKRGIAEFDLPPVIPMARKRLSAEGVINRVSLIGGDYLNDTLPTGADLAWLSAIIHQQGREENRVLFNRIHAENQMTLNRPGYQSSPQPYRAYIPHQEPQPALELPRRP